MINNNADYITEFHEMVHPDSYDMVVFFETGEPYE